MLADGEVEDAGFETRRKDLREAITRGLDRTSRLVLVLTELEGYSMLQVADMIFLSEGRVSQIHTAVLQQLQSKENLRALCRAG